MALLFELGPTISREAQSSIIRGYGRDITGVKDMVVVQFIDSPGLGLVLPVVAVVRVQGTIV